MKNSQVKKVMHQSLRKLFSFLPHDIRFAIYRSFVDCDPNPDPRLVLKIAETQDELEACFKLLHDAYVSSGFMKPDPSGMRVTIYHALPTTTTLCAKFDGEVVGTLSLIRESLFGFPLQAIFDLNQVRIHKGQLAEVSALAVHPKFRKTGGAILFPLMKFMFDYCTTFFDTRHLVIAVNPKHIEMYESLLLFQRLAEHPVERYDFANGAPAVGATLDLQLAPARLQQVYRHKRRRKNLHRYFVFTALANIAMPQRRYFTTNDPVMTPELLDYFFNRCTPVFEKLGERERGLLHALYNQPRYAAVLPPLPFESDYWARQRAYARYSLKCPGSWEPAHDGPCERHAMLVIECSREGFFALFQEALPLHTWGLAHIRLGHAETVVLRAMAVREQPSSEGHSYGFMVTGSDRAWRTMVGVLQWGSAHDDLNLPGTFAQD